MSIQYTVKNTAFIVLLVLVSFFMEYLGFIQKLHFQGNTDNKTSIVKISDVKAENFSLNEKGEFIAQDSDAILTIQTRGIYINNLELKLGKNPNYKIIVKYIDPGTGNDVVLKNDLERNMRINSCNFLDLAVYKIQNHPKEIVIIAPDSQTIISEIKIDNNYHFNPYRFLLILSCLFLLTFFIIFRKNFGEKPEVGFWVIAMISGTLLSYSEPRTYVSWDERIHYQYADRISFPTVLSKKVDDIYWYLDFLPASYSIKMQEVIDREFDSRIANEITIKNKEKAWNKFSLESLYKNVGYIPSGMALIFGRLFDFPYHIIFFFGRWANVLLYSTVVFFAIRKLNTGKMIMSVMALFPTAIFLASNYNYDSWVTAFTLLGLSYLFSELQQPAKKITWKETMILIGSLVIGLGPKAIYFPLLFLLFLIKPEKFSSLNQYKKFVFASGCSILFVVGSFMIPFLTGGPGVGDLRGGEAVNSAQQVQFILSEPFVYAKILINFMKYYLNPSHASGFVTFFAYHGFIKGFFLVVITLIIVVFTDKNKYDTHTSSLKVRGLIICIFLITVALICTALYISYSPVKSDSIAGVQDRYLIPLLFPLLYVLGSCRIRNPFNKNIYNGILFATMAFVLFKGVWDLFIKNHY
jgi:uncharacterized membrane protein